MPPPGQPLTPQQMQMQQLINMQAHMQQPIVLSQPSFSEEDVIRLATRMKQLLRDEIDELLEHKVALRVAPLQDEVDSLKRTVTHLEMELKKLSVRNDDLEQYSRRSCLRIAGIPETENEDTTKIVLDVAKRVGANISLEDIDRSHRVGTGKPAEQHEDDDFGASSNEPRVSRKNREIIVKFRTHGARLQLLKGRAFFRNRKENVYINEDLSKIRKNLAFACRQLRKNKKSPVTKTWVYNGNVFIQDNEDNKIRITSFEDLNPYTPPDVDEGL